MSTRRRPRPTLPALASATNEPPSRLRRPLGARVLLDSTDGGAIPVATTPTFR